MSPSAPVPERPSADPVIADDKPVLGEKNAGTLCEENEGTPCEENDEVGMRRSDGSMFSQEEQAVCKQETIVRDLMTFEGRVELLRGVPIERVLCKAGNMFGTSSGNENGYNTSKSVPRLAAFISHNWVVKRYKKNLALIFYYNIDVSFFLATLFFFGVLLLGVHGYLPTVRRDFDLYPVGFLGRLIIAPFFGVVLLCGRDLMLRTGYIGPRVFVDKVCIHQTDKEIQRACIERLGAFINFSDKMVVLYTDTYLRKLWTVYEVAGFLSVHPVSDMKVLPVAQFALFTGVCFLTYIYQFGIFATRAIFGSAWLIYPVGQIGGFAWVFLLRRWNKEKKWIIKRLSEFTVRDCVCFMESDRPVVYKNVAVLMKAIGDVDVFADEDTALDAFDQRVRKYLPSAFGVALGNNSFMYKHYLLLGFLNIAGQLSDMWAGYSEGAPLRYLLLHTCCLVRGAMVFWPLCLSILCETPARWLPNLSGWREILWIIVSTTPLTLVPTVVYQAAQKMLEARAVTSDLFLAVHAASVFITIPIPYLLLRDTTSSRQADDTGCQARDLIDSIVNKEKSEAYIAHKQSRVKEASNDEIKQGAGVDSKVTIEEVDANEDKEPNPVRV
jgi:hypothetical protein